MTPQAKASRLYWECCQAARRARVAVPAREGPAEGVSPRRERRYEGRPRRLCACHRHVSRKRRAT